ncbi:ornithine cyclodeaminase family protein [candidate division KSB1 bacterium]
MQVFSLNKSDIEKFIDYNRIISVIEKAFADHSLGKAVLPPVTNLDIVESEGEVHIKSGHIKNYDNYCIKIASGFWKNPERGLPTGNGMMLLFDAETGLMSGIFFDEGLLTDLRTAAAGAIASKYLSNENIKNVGVLGAGIQGKLQILFLSKVREFSKLYIWGKFKGEFEKYVEDMADKLPGVEFIECETPSESALCADILVTATPSREPLIKTSDIRKGQHITALGSDGPEKQEIPADAFKMFDKVIVDHVDQCSRLGETHHALEKGFITPEQIHAQLGEVITGKKKGRESEGEITISDLTGVAVQDIAISNWAMQRSKELGLGKIIEL